MRAHGHAAMLLAMAVACALAALADGSAGEPPPSFDITPFALPNSQPGEYRFEEPRDLATVVVHFRAAPPARVAVSYLQKTWPQTRLEFARALDDPCAFGWMPIDDAFNGQWRRAAIEVHPGPGHSLVIGFEGLAAEFPEATDYDVTFRRTVGVRIEVPDATEIAAVQIFTASPPGHSRLRVECDASGRLTPSARFQLSGYNARIDGIGAVFGVRVVGDTVVSLPTKGRSFEIDVSHMQPAHPYCNDDGLVSFALDREIFTISLASLQEEGPIWYPEQNIYIAFAGDPRRFADYRQAVAGAKTLNQRVLERREQTYAGAFNGQPRPHAVSANLGCKHNRQRFRLEANGDLVLHKWNVTSIPSVDTPRFKCAGDARFFFGLERQSILARYRDVSAAPAYTIAARAGEVIVEQRSVAVPLKGSILQTPLPSDATVVALLRFQFENRGDTAAMAELPVSYSQRSGRSENAYASDGQDDALVPHSERDSLAVEGGFLYSHAGGERVLRAAWDGPLTPEVQGRAIVYRRVLAPRERCELVLKVPQIALDRPAELQALRRLRFQPSEQEISAFWRREASRGAQFICPEPHLTALNAAHLAHVMITDPEMPDGSGLVNTSVGTSTYGNFANEACMVIHELDQRGLHEEARRRLDLWVKYQGTARQPGNFTDYEGMYFGAGGFECGDYNQHHGWVLWCLGEHYFLSGDATWLERTAPSLVAGCDWVFRQRRLTLQPLPHSRGWEQGFLPAGSLEDVTDFHYWLSTNALTWRGVDTAARALAAIGHPEAPRIAAEAAAYGEDLRRGFETMRQHAPLVRLRDGRWVPHYPSRLYWRGRDVGWIREVLEGAIYLLITGLYDSSSPQAQWILDDYQDNRYVRQPYSYPIVDFEANWYDRGGFSIQPNLLAGLLPHLDRDEPEIFLWMFFNAWCACYREEIVAMVEHPNPALGYSSAAHFKTSDESNAIAWLRAMLVYEDEARLHFGRALPREWLATEDRIETSNVHTRHGTASVSYRAVDGTRRMTATVDLQLRSTPSSILVRFRHPEKQPLRAAWINGEPTDRFDPWRNDVNITGLSGHVVVDAEF